MKRALGPNLRDARAMAQHALTFRGHLAAELEAADTRYSVLYCLIIIGEALNDIPPSVQSLAPDIKWRQIIDMRHILVHSFGEQTMRSCRTYLSAILSPSSWRSTGCWT